MTETEKLTWNWFSSIALGELASQGVLTKADLKLVLVHSTSILRQTHEPPMSEAQRMRISRCHKMRIDRLLRFTWTDEKHMNNQKNLSQQMHASHVKQHICGTVQVGGMSDITVPNTRDVHGAYVERCV